MGATGSSRRRDVRWTEHPSGLAVLSYGLGSREQVEQNRPALRHSASRWLTDAELEVAKLVLAGASNAEIARLRSVSERTVAKQVSACLKKLGVASRYELAAQRVE